MKRLINKMAQLLLLFTVAVILFPSCEYQEYADADYPDQLVYMPSAYYNPYMIDKIPAPRGSSPTPGYTERYKIDTQAGKFNVMLAAYRSGVYSNGSFTVNITANTDTISQLLASGTILPAGTLLLPSDKYSLVSSVEMKDGEELAKFDLSVDLAFLTGNSPNGKYAIGVEISSAEREINPLLSTTIVVIDTKILE